MRPQFIRELSHSESNVSGKALSLHRFLLRFALGATHIFAWVFIFEYFYFIKPDVGEAFLGVVLLYTLSQITLCLATPYTARFLYFGARKALIVGTALAALGFTLLNATFEGAWSGVASSSAIVGFALIMGLYRALYWVPYEVESEVNRRKTMSITRQLLIALAPLVGGLVIAIFADGPAWLMYGGATLMALSTIPLLMVRDIREKYSWGYRETFARLFHSENHEVVRESFFDGLSGAALLFFWPFVIFLLLGRSYDTLGVVLSITFVVAILMRAVIRKWMSRARLDDAPLLNTVLALSPWLFRLTVATPIGIVLVDSYFYTTTKRRLSVDPFVFEQIADGGTYVDEFTALKEVALALGRITTCLLAVLVLSFASVSVALTFVMLVAALASTAAVLWSQAK